MHISCEILFTMFDLSIFLGDWHTIWGQGSGYLAFVCGGSLASGCADIGYWCIGCR